MTTAEATLASLPSWQPSPATAVVSGGAADATGKVLSVNPAGADRTAIGALNCTTFQNQAISWPGSDTWFAETSGVAASVDSIARTIGADGCWHASFVPICAAEELTCAFDTGTAYARAAIIKTSAGYWIFYGWRTGLCGLAFKPIGGVLSQSSVPAWDGMADHLSWQLPNCLWTIRVYDGYSFSILLNGTEVTDRISTAGAQISAAGFGGYAAAACTFTLSYPSLASNVEARGKRAINIAINGDSISQRGPGSWDYHMREALDLSGGLRVKSITNMAVYGNTSAMQLAALLAAAPTGIDVAIIAVGTDDVQAECGVAALISNVNAMINYYYALSPPAKVIIFIPTLWLPATLGPQPQQSTDQVTANYEQGAPYRAALLNLAGKRGCRHLDLQQILGRIVADDLTAEMGSSLADKIHPPVASKRVMGVAAARVVAGAMAMSICP